MPKSAARSAKAVNIHVVAGSDEAEVKRAALDLAARLTPADAGDFGNDVIDGCAENVEQAATRIHQTIEALMTLPFFGGEKLVWLKSANFLADSITGRSATVLETLAKISQIEVYDKLDASRSGWEEEAASVIETKAAERELRFSSDALELFTLLTGGNTRQIENELEKLDLYLGETRRSITPEDVRLLVPLSRAGVIFELGNAFARRDLKLSFSLVEQLLNQGESAIGILLVAIAPTVRNLLAAKELMQTHRLSKPHAPFQFTGTLNRLPPTAIEHLPRKKDGTINGYALGLAAMHAHRFTMDELVELLEGTLEANVQLVSSQLEPKVVLSQLIGRLALPGQ
jgi:DNA polymerase III subunit delta